jgi:hypothetical protein
VLAVEARWIYTIIAIQLAKVVLFSYWQCNANNWLPIDPNAELQSEASFVSGDSEYG